MINSMDQEKKPGMMVRNIKEIMKMELNQEMENFILKMVSIILVSF